MNIAYNIKIMWDCLIPQVRDFKTNPSTYENKEKLKIRIYFYKERKCLMHLITILNKHFLT